jgi:hypothetical protein
MDDMLGGKAGRDPGDDGPDDRSDDRMKRPPVPGSRRDQDFDRPEAGRTDGGIPEPVNAATGVITQAGRQHPCPSCSSRSVAAIRYGMPAGDWQHDPGLGVEFTLGGCCIWPEMPEFHCHACDNQWRDRPPESGPGRPCE